MKTAKTARDFTLGTKNHFEKLVLQNSLKVTSLGEQQK